MLPALFALLGCSPGEPPPGTLDTFEINSARADFTYTVAVFTPDALTTREGATVLYVFDGVENQASVLAEYAAALDDGVTPAVLVLVPGTNRTFDFTPTGGTRGNGGGQEAFMAFVTEELAPQVEVDGIGGSPDERVTFGHSLGGLLSATLWYDRPFATRAGIASPSMWWDGGLFFAKLAAAPLNPGPIVVGCGEYEPMGMVPYTADFSDAMRDDYGIPLTYEVFSRTAHPEAYAPAIALTFRSLL
jgi:predicted alpha/beta superfamily hydrolase